MSNPITNNSIKKSAIEILQSQGREYAKDKEMSIQDNIKDNASLEGLDFEENTYQRQNQGQFVLDKLLFDLKTASHPKVLKISTLLFDSERIIR